MTDTTANAEAGFVPANRRVYVLVAAILASAMGFIDGSVTSIATPAIRASIGASLADAQWVSNAYLLTLSSLLLLGGAASDRFGQRNVFVAGIIVFVIASILLMTQTPADKPEAGRRLDILGAATVTVALLQISLAFIDSESGRFWIYLIAGLVTMAVYLFWETRSKEPMLPLGLFADKGFSGAQGLTLVLYFGLSAVTFYLPMTMIAGWGVSPAIVSIVLLPLGIALTLLSPFAGKVTDRMGPGPVLAFGSLIVGASFLGLGLTAGLHSPRFAVLPLMILFGVGMSFVAGPVSTAEMTSVADRGAGK